MRERMIFDPDHMSVWRNQALNLVEGQDYPQPGGFEGSRL